MLERIKLNEKKLAALAKRHSVSELAIFGSVLRDDFLPESDVDILVTFLPGTEVSLFDLVDIGDELSRLIGREVDLVPKQGLKRAVRQSIVESSQVIYAAA